MNRLVAGPLRRPSLIAAGWAALIWCLAASPLAPSAGAQPGATRSAEAKPTKKDSRATAQPKEAKFTTSVTPAQAKPGDVVTYQVKAKLTAPWHIYKYAKEPAESGPKLTEFDFFDTAGLKLEKTWTAKPEPIKKEEPAFPEIPFLEYHEDEVVWSQQLKIPADAKPGKRTLRCQVGYMLCSDQNCTMPGQWTLPPAEVTVTAPSGKPSSRRLDDQPRVRLVSARLDDPKPAGAQPKEEDSGVRMTKAIRWTTEFVPVEAKAGEKVQLKLTAQVKEGYHIFQFAPSWNDQGPKPLLIDAFDLQGLVPAGTWTSSRAPERKKDPNFKELDAVEFFEGEVSWSLPLEVPGGTAPGSKPVRVQAGFQVCSNKLCEYPGQWTLPTATLTVAPGGAPASAGAPVAATPSKPPLDTPAAANTSAATTVDPQSSPASSVSDIQRTREAGLIPFLLACAGAGLLALAMPCVWPMIPVTVNFFVKQGGREGGRPTGLAITYCLAIIGIFTGIGVLFSALLGASSLSTLANNPWLNTAVAALFFAFGLSLIGLFEIRLPNFLLNASAQGESRGGLIGVMFMATTLTITSFTCTFPVVGGLLVVASKGNYLDPIIGLATFATVVALPFFLLALAPGLLSKLPKSGDWMNSVKVVGGLIELAAAFKFVNTAELGFDANIDNVWIDEQTLLTIWVVTALVCGVYLLGLFRTDHDQKEAGIGPMRLLLGAGFLSLALYLAPALFGKPPEGQFYKQFVVGLLPPTGSEKKATSTDPEIAITQEKTLHGVLWGMSYAQAIADARSQGKKVLIDFTGVNCANCRQMERTVFPRSDVAAKLGEFVTVQLHTDYVPIGTLTQPQKKKLGQQNIQRQLDLVHESTNPYYVIIDPTSEQPVAQIGGYNPPAVFLEFLDKGATAPPAKVVRRD